MTHEEYDRIVSGAEAAKAVVAADRAAIETAQLQLSYCEIHSPIDGRTGSLQVHQGNLVKANDTAPLVVINQVRPIYVQFAVPEARALAAARALRRQAGAGHRHAAGRRRGADRNADVRRQRRRRDHRHDHAQGDVRQSRQRALARPVRQRRRDPRQTARTPSSSRPRPCRTASAGNMYYVVKNDNGVEMRPVTAAQSVNQETVIDKGINAGETVVTDGQVRLTAKSKVEVKTQL